jgi:hypothetical protein
LEVIAGLGGEREEGVVQQPWPVAMGTDHDAEEGWLEGGHG